MDVEDFWVEYVDASGGDRQGPLRLMWPARFEAGTPVRVLRSFKGQRNFTGLYWSATTGGHVGYESWLERDHLMRLDFDPQVVAMASQPFRLSWPGGRSGRIEHTPDYFARRLDGTGLVVDVRPDNRIPEADAAKFTATAVACEAVGWDFERVGEVDPVFAANLRWLAGYRHPRVMRPAVAAALRASFAQGCGLFEGASAVGDPIAVLPVLFHLLWCRQLTVDLHSVVLSASSPVCRAEGGGDGAVTAAIALGG